MIINSNFDGGNIKCLDASSPDNIRLSIRKDHQSDFYQWFYFRVSGVRDQACRFIICNAANAAYPAGWKGYRVVASYDRQHWFRVDSHYQDSEFIFEHKSACDQVYFAYFAPYSMERHADLIASAQQNPHCQAMVLGQSIDGQDMDCLRFGNPGANKKVLWMVARQHPGETMAEWWMEGVINRLSDADDAVSRTLLERSVIYLVPNMNPDGSRRGHLRCNAVGANLNREWISPSTERSPEVFYVFKKMQQTGLDFALDVHGDEALPYNFIAGTEGIPGWNPQRQKKLQQFKDCLAAVNPDFQTRHGYPPNLPGTGKLSYCSNALAEHFNAPAMTLEMPFKDSIITPDPRHGWSPARCKLMGRHCLDAIHQCWHDLFDITTER